ncbi:MAG TPA: hypothetical protein VGN95_17990 [Pyrinomonadaceae bacterium]|jgi:hypothetical protein|nr:hypothetical protein [Pyrinomonadaceae bacterium]
MAEYEKLFFRGNFGLTRDIDFSEALLSARYPGGYREDVIIGSTAGLRAWKLSYPALLKNTLVKPPDREPESRHDYIWNFFCRSKSAGNLPFKLEDTDGKLYLCIFTSDKLTYNQVDFFLSTSGLDIL